MDGVNVVDVTDLYFIELMEWLRVMIWKKKIDVIVSQKPAFLRENGNKSVDEMEKACKWVIQSTHKTVSREPFWKVTQTQAGPLQFPGDRNAWDQ